MVCDLAETYHIYNYRELPVQILATFVVGLRANSRVMMKINGSKISLDTMISASILDNLKMWIWMNSDDGAKRRNRPESLIKVLNNIDESNQENILIFETSEEFEKQRKLYLERILNNGN